MKFTLCIATSQSCRACVLFKANIRDKLMNVIKEEFPTLEVKEQDMSSDKNIAFHEDVTSRIFWFPFLAILVARPKANNVVHVFNGKNTRGIMENTRSNSFTLNGIASWIREIIVNEPLFCLWDAVDSVANKDVERQVKFKAHRN